MCRYRRRRYWLCIAAGMRVVSAFQAIRSFGRSGSPIQSSRSVADQMSSRECRNWKLAAICRPVR
ncbi:hypothetical protein Y695_04824 [Hydrogenophaga sp. T4]|nr:hypothetical protein Y695_04824 [Hydrogenophaga sp. T4]